MFSDEGPLLETLAFFTISRGWYQPSNFLRYLTLSTQQPIFISLTVAYVTTKYVTRSFNINNLTEFRCNTEFYRHSYFPRVIRAWNSLPSEMKSTSEINVFKRKLRDHLSKLTSYVFPYNRR